MLSSRLKYAVEEIKFIKSAGDARIFLKKAAFLLPRLMGRFPDRRVPPSIQVEPTNFCNARCICCSNERITRGRGFMDIALFRDIIDQAKSLGVPIIHLFMNGEPLLHPRIVEMVRYTKSQGLAVHLTTNGMPLDPGKIDDILSAGLDSSDYFVFSVLGHSEPVHEKVMRGVRRRTVLANIYELLRRREELGLNGPVIETIFYTLPENIHEKEDFLDFWKGRVDHARAVGICRAYSDFMYGGPADIIRNKTCSNLWERMIVYWNGDVTVCSRDIDGAFSFGNIRERPLEELWNHQYLAAVKEAHKRRDFGFFSLCRNCDM